MAGKSLMVKQMAIPLPVDEIKKLQDELVKCIIELKELQLQRSIQQKAYTEVINGKSVRVSEIAETLKEQSGVDVSIEQLLQEINLKVEEQAPRSLEDPDKDKD